MRPVSPGSDFLVRGQDRRGGRTRKTSARSHFPSRASSCVGTGLLRGPAWESTVPVSPCLLSVTVLNAVSNPGGFCFGQKHIHGRS